jgi:hypothetical protein
MNSKTPINVRTLPESSDGTQQYKSSVGFVAITNAYLDDDAEYGP